MTTQRAKRKPCIDCKAPTLRRIPTGRPDAGSPLCESCSYTDKRKAPHSPADAQASPGDQPPISSAQQQRNVDPPRPRKLPLVAPLSTVEPVELTWLWESWIPSGGLTMFDGLPGDGKSAVMVDLCTRVTRGMPMPDDSPGIGPAPVVYFNYEDASNGTLHRRFSAAEADIELVHAHEIAEDGMTEVLDLCRHSEIIEQIIVGTRARLVVIDTIEHAAPGINLDKGQETRRVLGPLNRLGQRLNVAIILIRHFNKNSGERNPTLRGAGSIGIVGVARAAMMVTPDPDAEDDQGARILARYKCNDGIPVPAQRFGLVGDPGKVRIEWRGESRHSPRDLMGHDDDGPRGRREEAKAFLAERLADGPAPANAVYSEAKADGIATRTLDRARSELDVQHRREGGCSFLYLPDAPGAGGDSAA